MKNDQAESSTAPQRRSQKARRPKRDSNFVYVTNFNQGNLSTASIDCHQTTDRPPKRRSRPTIEEQRESARKRKRASRLANANRITLQNVQTSSTGETQKNIAKQTQTLEERRQRAAERQRASRARRANNAVSAVAKVSTFSNQNNEDQQQERRREATEATERTQV
ncbi:hypothetical protein BD560DRAFT_410506 [Blakeslea trispora]|nr:hypothetical protein BD560DRAFT_410506 [Blakeslea trispora]